MLDLVKDESERIDSRFLEPACGSGKFLVSVLKRKLVTVEARYGMSDFEKRNYALDPEEVRFLGDTVKELDKVVAETERATVITEAQKRINKVTLPCNPTDLPGAEGWRHV